MEERAFAKLNLTLDILRKREDGFHDLRMVMQNVALCDEISLEERDREGMTLHTKAAYLPTDENNIAVKAAKVFARETGLSLPGLDLTIHKRLPVCAGMAGGSSDGAAVLRMLSRRYRPDMGREELERIAVLVGSDVPFCVRGGAALAEGRGERLRDLPGLPDCTVLLCKPDFPISTPELFGLVRVKKLRFHPDTAGMLRALERGDLEEICRYVYNVFEDVLPRKYQRVWEIKRQMLELDALTAAMTGSGPTVFGIFADEAAAREAARVLEREYRQVYVTAPWNEKLVQED